MKPLKKGWLSSLIVAALIFLMAGQASAAVDAYVVRENNVTYKYMLRDLVQSFNTDEVLWNDFNDRMMRSGVLAVYDFERNRYVRFTALVEAFNEGIDCIEYTERETVETVQASGPIMLTTAENNAVVQTNWNPPPVIPISVHTVNASTNAQDMQAALVNNAEQLGLGLGIFNSLTSYGKDQVAAQVLASRPQGGFVTTDALKEVFDGAVLNAQLIQNEAVKEINNVGTPSAMESALINNATVLQLDIVRFTKLNILAKGQAALEIVNKRPYTDANSVRDTYASLLSAVEAGIIVTYTDYAYTLGYMSDVQVGKNPQTDLYGGGWKTADRNIVEWHVNPNNFTEGILPAVKVLANNVNVRQGPSTAFPTLSFQLNSGNGPYFIMNQVEDSEGFTWYRLKASTWVGWVRADFVILTTEKAEGIFQFLVLSGTTGVPAQEINNNILLGKGILEGRAEAFIQGCQQYNINEIFLTSLALHESGNGTSQLATGVQYNGVTVYNMYGIGAYDQDPINAGAKFAFEQGWFTPELAIVGGAKFASQNYINHPTYKQDTLYKMRWNPGMPSLHQYATDVGWAAKQVKRIKELYELLNTYSLRFDIPRYR